MNKDAVLDIVYYPHREIELRQISQEVTAFGDQTRNLADIMLKTMEYHQGIGLAAPQVGLKQRVFVMKVPEHDSLPKIFINPIVIDKSDEIMDYEEGCLSIPDFRATISRPKYVKITALNKEGNPFEIELEGLPAICVQHEIDHLDGILFVDYISRLKRSRLKKKMLKNS